MEEIVIQASYRGGEYKFYFSRKDNVYFRPNTSLGPLSFMFVSDRFFKFLGVEICPLSSEFISDRSFKFLRVQISPLNFEFVSDWSFLSTSIKQKLIWPLAKVDLVREKIDAKCQREPPHPLNRHISFSLTDKITLT